MRHLALALAACLLVTGAFAEAAPRRAKMLAKQKRAKPKHVEVAPVEDDEAEEEDDDEAAPERVGVRADEEEADDEIDVPLELQETAKRARPWNFAIGPYLWASSVEADVSLGSQSVGAGVDFMDLKRHARYGIELLAEARFGRFSLTGDFTYGVVDLDGSGDVGPLMVNVEGSASSMLIDGAAGVTLVGHDHSLFALEARAGIRYQNTKIEGAVMVDGSTLASPSIVDKAADGVAGARAFLRPLRKLAIAGAFDTRAFGTSKATWSTSVDASYQFGARVLVSLGWRTLKMDRESVSITMFGPRAAVQLLF